jgi:hypothetical protein
VRILFLDGTLSYLKLLNSCVFHPSGANFVHLDGVGGFSFSLSPECVSQVVNDRPFASIYPIQIQIQNSHPSTFDNDVTIMTDVTNFCCQSVWESSDKTQF